MSGVGIDLFDEWSGNTYFEGISLEIDDQGGSANSNLIRIHVNDVDKFVVNKNGKITVGSIDNAGVKGPNGTTAGNIAIYDNDEGTILGDSGLGIADIGSVSSVTANTDSTGTDVSVAITNPNTNPNITISIPTASASNRGALSNTDWSTFNNKQVALISGFNIKTVNSTTLLGSGDVSVGVTNVNTTLTATGTDISVSVATSTTTPNVTINIPTASATKRGALSAANWSTFNGKQDALVSNTNIKTVNGVTLLGAGDLGAIGIGYGGTGLKSTPTNGQVLIGNGSGFALSTLTQGNNITITNSAGGITIAATANKTWTHISNTVVSTPVSDVTMLGIPKTYDDLKVVVTSLSHNNASNVAPQIQVSTTNGSSWSTTSMIIGDVVASGATLSGSVRIFDYTSDASVILGGVMLSNPGIFVASPSGGIRATTGINALKFTFTAGSIDGGTIAVYVR